MNPNLGSTGLVCGSGRRALRILFFSRGRGQGHAVRDLYLASELERKVDSADIHFASYATGVQILRTSKYHLSDMGLPESNTFTATLLSSSKLIESYQPDIVLSHEEFAAVVSAANFEIPCIYFSSWLPAPHSTAAETLCYADSIIIFSEPGIFPFLPSLKTKPYFTGPLIRPLPLKQKSKDAHREDCNIPRSGFVAVVCAGGWASEQRAPLLPLLKAAWAELEISNKHLVWIASDDADQVKTHGLADVRSFITHIEPVLASSDIVITKANRGVTMEAAELGIPTISISFGTNPIDDLLISRVRSNTALNVNALDSTALSTYLRKAVRGELMAQPPDPSKAEKQRAHIAERLCEEVRRLTGN